MEPHKQEPPRKPTIKVAKGMPASGSTTVAFFVGGRPATPEEAQRLLPGIEHLCDKISEAAKETEE